MFNAHFYRRDGSRSEDTIADSKALLVSTMKQLLAIFDDWDGFVVVKGKHLCYEFDKNYNYYKQKGNNDGTEKRNG